VADQQTGEAVTVDSRFRIASVSKPITSAAIFKLIDQGKLRLTDKVFGPGAVLGNQYGSKPYSEDVQKITVQNLLEHTAGGWGNSHDDPMFSNPTLDQGQLIGWVLDNRPLTSTTGTTFDYSNFGYCLLGRVIEKVTGQDYATAVQNLVLTPSGITGMSIGGNTLADRQANEVRYYGQGGEDPYSMQVSRMDSHGGWVASATDLLRFAVRVNGQPGKADILSAASIAQMTTASAANSGYAKGWYVNAVPNWWHMGTMPGTESILVRTASGYTWSMLLNTRSLDPSFASALDDLMWKVVNDVGTFPAIDLWS
jgi:CubicO group peptidase (beta-lactamase class C family)